MTVCENCGDEITTPDSSKQIVAVGGWSVPSELLAEMIKNEPVLCSDCKTRLMFISEYGFDPGKDGENLRAPRGGIKFDNACRECQEGDHGHCKDYRVCPCAKRGH